MKTAEQLSSSLAEAEALLRDRGTSTLIQNAYGSSQTAIWTGLVTKVAGEKHHQTAKDITRIHLVGGDVIWADMTVQAAHAALMVG